MTADSDPRIDVLLMSGAVLGAGTMVGNGLYHPLALSLVVVAFVLLTTQLTRRSLPVAPAALERRITIAYAIQAAALLASIGKHLVDYDNTDTAIFWMIASAVGAAIWLWGGRDAIRLHPRSRVSFYVCLAGFLIVSLATLAATSSVVIDVHAFQQVAADRLLAGHNPYLAGYPDVYSAADSRRFYGEGLSRDGLLQFGFPYPPLGLLLIVPAHLLGGLQLAHISAIVGTGVLLSRLGFDRASRLGAVFFLTSAPTVFLISQSWTEAFVVFMLALTLWAHTREFGRGAAMGLLAATKQYCLFFVPLYPLLVGGIENWRTWSRRLLVGGLTAAAVTVPFALWDVGAFMHSVVELQFLQPFRPDALSLAAFAAAETGWRPALIGLLPFVAAVCAISLSLIKAPRTPAGFALAVAITWLGVVLVSKQAFANYYFTALSAIYAAVAASGSVPATPSSR